MTDNRTAPATLGAREQDLEILASLAADLENAPGFVVAPKAEWFRERADVLREVARRMSTQRGSSSAGNWRGRLTTMDEAEALVRLVVESFRDASEPSVEIAVEEILRTVEPWYIAAVNALAKPPSSSERRDEVTDARRLDWMLKHGASVLVLADHRHALDYQPMNRDELDDLMRREAEARAINTKLDAADRSTATTGHGDRNE